MNVNEEIVKKYSMLFKIKIMIISFGILTTILFSIYYFLKNYISGFLEIVILILLLIIIILFIVMWSSVRPIKKNIINLIDESKNNNINTR